MICTEGCPTSAIAYKWENPLNENFQIFHYRLNKEMFSLKPIADLFYSIHAKDLFLLPIVLLFGFSIDGLYGMGHFLSFGIATIAGTQLFIAKNKYFNVKINLLISSFIVLIFIWHGLIKFSVWQGLEEYNNKNFERSIPHLERAIKLYPKPIGKFHFLLAEMYLKNNEYLKAKNHALRSLEINPNYNSPNDLLKKIDKIDLKN
tara:strand:- start:165 stop:776 length:612 start_codon:yes stop_codon:yes gene_type:complete